METLITLGETTQSKTKWKESRAELLDLDGREYKHIDQKYQNLLKYKTAFIENQMRAFDFKLIKGSGKRWQEAPDGLLEFMNPDGDESIVCRGIVSYVHLGHNRAYGIVYVKDFEWLLEQFNFTT